MANIRKKEYSKAANKLIRGKILHDDTKVEDVSFTQSGGRYYMEYFLGAGFVSIPLEESEWKRIFKK